MNRSPRSLAVVLALALAPLAFAGCEKQESASAYDPRLDGVLPKSNTPDLSVFDNQAELYKKVAPAPAPPPVPAPATATAPATAPATEPAADTPATAPATP